MSQARDRISGQRVVIVGIGVDQMRIVERAGATIVGAISVLPSGSLTPLPPEPLEVLTLKSATRDILEHVVAGFAAAITRASDEVGAFLDRVDPDRTAVVAAYLPIPHQVLGDRRSWTADAAISLPLEYKSGPASPLAAVVPIIPVIPLPAGEPAQWWPDACSHFGVERLVVQVEGITGGGTGTWVCDRASGVPHRSDAFVSPFLQGVAGNVMGVVDTVGATLVMPATRQLIRLDDSGHPLYAGNVTGEPWATRDRKAIADEVRAIGRELASRGFFGPFGVDFIGTPAGHRFYHDLNPRMNGAVDSLARLVEGPAVSVPLVAALLSRPLWEPEELDGFEDDLHDAVSTRPLARLWLTTVIDRNRTVEAPPAGAWAIDDMDPPRVSFLGAADIAATDVAACRPVVELQPLLPPESSLQAGDRLALGNLYCEPVLGDRLVELCGADLIDAFLA